MSGNYDSDSLAEARLDIGSVVKDTYELVAVLGEGGMGTVFKALNKVWEEVEARDPYVAIKVLKPELSANKQLVGLYIATLTGPKCLQTARILLKFTVLIEMVHMFT